MFCKSACQPSNPATDSVRVDAVNLIKEVESRHAKEEAEKAERERAEQLAEQQRLEQEEAERIRQEEEVERMRLEEQRALEEEERLKEEEERLKEQARLEEEARRAQEEEMELRRREEEAQRREEAERLAREQELRERHDALDLFYKQHGFLGANEPRRSGCGVWAATTTYPLHCAAELADARIAEMLLKEGAMTAQKNSSGKTAAQVAQKKNKGGSHDDVLRVLGGHAKPSVGGA